LASDQAEMMGMQLAAGHVQSDTGKDDCNTSFVNSSKTENMSYSKQILPRIK